MTLNLSLGEVVITEVVIDPLRMRSLLSKAMDAGVAPDLYAMTWDKSGLCALPKCITLVSQIRRKISWSPVAWMAGSPVWWEDNGEDLFSSYIEKPFFLHINVRCRKCEQCREARKKQWFARALHETELSARTWFCTYTLSPDNRLRASCEAHSDDPLDIARVVSRWFSAYLKRVRKNASAPIRFMMAVEQHKDGAIHLHALLHETQMDAVTKSLLQSEWPYGFSQVKLCKSGDVLDDIVDVRRTVYYVCKYTTKTLLARTKASLFYGDRPRYQAKVSEANGREA